MEMSFLALHFWGSQDRYTMTPIAVIAFLVGINGTAPSAPPVVTKQEPKSEKPAPKPSKGNGSAKVRGGGWDLK